MAENIPEGFRAFVRRPACTITIALCLISVALLLLEFAKARSFGFDYRVFRYSSQVNVGDIYDPHPQAPFVYPPTAIAFFRPLGQVPISVGFAVWMLLSASLFLYATRSINRLAIAFVSISPVLVKCVLLGQSALVLSALVLLAADRKGWLGGLLLGLVLTIKPQMAILAPLALLVRKDWQAVAGMIAGSLAMFLAELILYGFQPWSDWWAALPLFRQTLIENHLLWIMVTPAGVAQNFGLPVQPALVFGLLLGVASILGSARHAKGPELAGLIVTASVLAVPYAASHDLIALLPWTALLLLRERLSLPVLAAVLVLTMEFMAVGLVIFAMFWSLRVVVTRDHRSEDVTSNSN
jgi:hypothetical protein